MRTGSPFTHPAGDDAPPEAAMLPLLEHIQRQTPRIPPFVPALARSTVHAVIEVLAGRRNSRQLEPLMARSVLEKVTLRAGLVQAASGPQPASRGRTRTDRSAPARSGPTIGRVLAQQTGTRVYEAAVVVHGDPQLRMAALQLSLVRGRWVVTALELG